MDKYLDYVLANGPWMIAGMIVAAGLLIAGYNLAGVLVAVAGLIAAPQLVGAFERYGLGEAQRRNALAGLIGTAMLAFLLIDPAGADDNGEAEAASASEGEEIEARQSLPVDEIVTNCVAIDGDTLRCDGERIRLLGIDAPEMPGSCVVGRECVPGDPFASKASLAAAMTYEMGITRVGSDRYGRTLAMVYPGGYSLSCLQLINGQAAYVPDWDDGGLVAAECL